MVNTSEETTGKKKRTYWLEPSLIDDLDRMETLTGSDKTKIIHEAVRRYKESAEFRAKATMHQREIAAANASLESDPNSPVYSLADQLLESGHAVVKHVGATGESKSLKRKRQRNK